MKSFDWARRRGTNREKRERDSYDESSETKENTHIEKHTHTLRRSKFSLFLGDVTFGLLEPTPTKMQLNRNKIDYRRMDVFIFSVCSFIYDLFCVDRLVGF